MSGEDCLTLEKLRDLEAWIMAQPRVELKVVRTFCQARKMNMVEKRISRMFGTPMRTKWRIGMKYYEL